MRRPDQVHREETPPESKPRQDGRGMKVVCPFQEPAQTEIKIQDADGQERRDGI